MRLAALGWYAIRMESDGYTESDCCANGCANCILDSRSRKSTLVHRLDKPNIIATYSKFRLLSKIPHQPTPTVETTNAATQLFDVWELHFGCADATQTADYILDIPPGHHVMLRAPLAAAEQSTDSPRTWLRPYSPYWVDVSQLEFKILVNLQPQGPMSRYIAKLQPGDEAEFRGPIGNYVHAPSEASAKCVCIVSQGVAIAPTLPIVRQILDNEDDVSRICHLACFSDLAHVYFRNTLQEFNRYWNYSGCIFLAHQLCERVECASAGGCNEQCDSLARNLRYKERVRTRRLQAADLNEVCQGAKDGTERRFVICGSRTFQDSIGEMVRQLDLAIKDENIFLL